MPVLEKAFRLRKRPVGKNWRMDETYIRVKGEWRYLYRAVDKDGNIIDFLLRAHRDKTAVRRYFEKSIARNGTPETVTIDKTLVNAPQEVPLGDHLDKITQTELVAQIPTHAKDDDFAVEMTPVEQPFEIFQLAHWLVVVKSSRVTDRRAGIAPQPKDQPNARSDPLRGVVALPFISASCGHG